MNCAFLFQLFLHDITVTPKIVMPFLALIRTLILRIWL